VSSTLAAWWRKFRDSCKYLVASLAIILVKRQVGRRPQDWSLWLLLGRLYSVGYQWPQAVNCLKRARKLNPENEVIARLLAEAKENLRGRW